jgi:hypothetical protein
MIVVKGMSNEKASELGMITKVSVLPFGPFALLHPGSDHYPPRSLLRLSVPSSSAIGVNTLVEEGSLSSVV